VTSVCLRENHFEKTKKKSGEEREIVFIFEGIRIAKEEYELPLKHKPLKKGNIPQKVTFKE